MVGISARRREAEASGEPETTSKGACLAMLKVDLFGVLETILGGRYLGIAPSFLSPKTLINKTALESERDANRSKKII